MNVSRMLGALLLGVSVLGSLFAGHASGTAAQAATGRVRVVHLSPDAPPVDVLVDGQKAIAGLAYTSASPYAALPAGSHDVKVTPAGQNGTVVLQATLPVQAGQDQTVLAVGKLANIGAVVLADDNSAPAPGKAAVRFVHGAVDAPAVDVAVTGGPVLFSNVAFTGSAGPAQVDAGSYDLEVRATGTQTVALRVPGVPVQAGQNLTVFAAGLVGDTSLAAVPITYPATVAVSAMPATGTGGLVTDGERTPLLSLLAGTAILLTVVGASSLAYARRRAR